MKKYLKAMLAMLAVSAIGASSAQAIELRNEDTRNHTVTISSPTMHKSYEFRARTLSLIVCIGECDLTLADGSSVRAKQDDIVSIRDGQVSIVPRVPDQTAGEGR